MFIDPDFKKKEEFFRKEISKEIKYIQSLYNSKIENDENQNLQWLKIQHFMQKKLKKISPSIEIFIDHIEYIIKLIGIDYVAIGSDYDGLDCLPNEITDCRDHFIIAKSLDHRGYKNSEIEKIMGLNFLRVFNEVKK